MSQFVVAFCVSLRLAGKSFQKIASHRLVKKRDGTSPTQQAVAKAIKNHKTLRRSAKWRLNGAGKKSTGRPKKLTKAQVKEMNGLIRRNPGGVRAPFLKRKLKLSCTLRTIQRAVATLGYSLCRRGSKKVLSRRVKKLRLKWAASHEARTRVWWKNRGFADGHYWYLPRTRAEAAAPHARGTSVLRKKGEGQAPKHQGGSRGGYKQGKKVGVWGVLTMDGLRVHFLPKGKLTAAVHTRTVRRMYPAWAGWTQGVVHDGERALWAPAPKKAYADLDIPALKNPHRAPI